MKLVVKYDQRNLHKNCDFFSYFKICVSVFLSNVIDKIKALMYSILISPYSTLTCLTRLEEQLFVKYKHNPAKTIIASRNNQTAISVKMYSAYRVRVRRQRFQTFT